MLGCGGDGCSPALFWAPVKPDVLYLGPVTMQEEAQVGVGV